jgi:hypothetical protein
MPFCTSLVRLADAEHGVLVAALGDGPADASRFEQVHRDHRGDDADRAAPADDAGDGFLVEAVLQRHHVAVGREVRRDQVRRPRGVVGLHRHHGDVERAPVGLQLGEVQDLRPGDDAALGRRHAVQLQPLGADGLDVLRPGVHQGDVLPELRQPAADIASQGACAHDRYPFCHSVIIAGHGR